MALTTKTTLVVSFLLVILCSVDGISGGANPEYPLHKVFRDGFRISSRKLSVPDAVLDYDDAGPNPRHDPRKGRGGHP